MHPAVPGAESQSLLHTETKTKLPASPWRKQHMAHFLGTVVRLPPPPPGFKGRATGHLHNAAGFALGKSCNPRAVDGQDLGVQALGTSH